MNLNQLSYASIAVLTVTGTLAKRLSAYAGVSYRRPSKGVSPLPIEGCTPADRERLTDALCLLETVKALDAEVLAESDPATRRRLAAKLASVQHAIRLDLGDLLGRMRRARFGNSVPKLEAPSRPTRASVLECLQGAVRSGLLPEQILQMPLDAPLVQPGKKTR